MEVTPSLERVFWRGWGLQVYNCGRNMTFWRPREARGPHDERGAGARRGEQGRAERRREEERGGERRRDESSWIMGHPP